MYQISNNVLNDIFSIQIKNISTNEIVEIVPSLGANVNKLVLSKNGVNHSILRSYNSYSEFINFGIFNNAKLFPFPNRIYNGKFIFQNVNYELEKNYKDEGNACHGFVYNKDFDVVSQSVSDEKAEITLEYINEEQIPGYPFLFKLSLTYVLNKDGFECKTTVENIGYESMPMGDGWHPFFKLNSLVDDLYLQFNSDSILNVEDKFINKKGFKKFNNLEQIKDLQLDDCFNLRKNGNLHNTYLFDKSKNLEVVLWQETGIDKYNYLQIYIPPERDSIAIEPMTCPPNSFNNKENLIILESGDKTEFKYGIYIK